MRKAFHRIAKPLSRPPSRPMLQHFEEAPVKIGLVLTGGGSHGAFEAGVLESILPEISRHGKILSITGTSAGALNATAAGSGLNASGTDESAFRLRQVWDSVKTHSSFLNHSSRFFTDAFLPPQQRWPNIPNFSFAAPINHLGAFMPSLTAQFISSTIKTVAPDWKHTVQNGDIKIAVNTVLEQRTLNTEPEHVILTGADLTPDGVAASANLKQLGIHYIQDSQNPAYYGRRAYDGAYKENGPLHPHLDEGVTDIIMIVLHDRRHNKTDEDGHLKHAEIHSKALDIMAYDSPLPIRFHAIEIESLGGEIGGFSHMDDSSKFNTNAAFIDLLYQSGIEAGQKWLSQNSHLIGQRSSYTVYPPALQLGHSQHAFL